MQAFIINYDNYSCLTSRLEKRENSPIILRTSQALGAETALKSTKHRLSNGLFISKIGFACGKMNWCYKLDKVYGVSVLLIFN